MSNKKLSWTPRQLKFKVWGCFEKKWITNWKKQVGKNTPVCFLPEEMSRDDEGATVQFFDSFNGSFYRFLQYTGLNDSNDIEIYEGDIVKVSSEESSNENFIACVIFDEGNYCFKINDEDIRCFSAELYSNKEIIVIGNICENPKLLTKVKIKT